MADTKKKKVMFSLSENTVNAIKVFSELVGLSNSDIVSLAVSNYLMGKVEFIYSDKLRNCFTDEQIKVYEQMHGKIEPLKMQTTFDVSNIMEKENQ